MSEKRAYKYCFVPKCKNTASKNPSKIFIPVPKGKIREKWLALVRRDPSTSLLSSLHCCEDHFQLDKDLENYQRLKFDPTANVLLKKGVLPRFFESASPPLPRLAAENEKKCRTLYKLLKMSMPADSSAATGLLLSVKRPTRTYRKNSSSSHLMTCRACLSTDVKLLHVKDKRLTEAFKTVTGLPLPEKDRLPPYLCIYCCVLINRCSSFRKQCILNQNIMKSLDSAGKLTLRSIKTVAQGLGRTLTRSEVHTSGYSPDGPADSREGFVDTPGGSGETNRTERTNKNSRELVDIENSMDTLVKKETTDYIVQSDHNYFAESIKEEILVKEEIIDDSTEFTNVTDNIVDYSDGNEDTEKPEESSGDSEDVNEPNRRILAVKVFEEETDNVSSKFNSPVTGEDNLRVFEPDVKMEVLDEDISETTPEQLGHEEKEVKTDFTNFYDNIFPNIDIDEHFDPLSTEKCDGPSVSSDHKLDVERVRDSSAVDASEIHESQNAQIYNKEKDEVSTKNSFKCGICNKLLNSKGYLKKHLQIHAKRERFSCDVCSKSFLWKSHLNAHKRRHFKEQQYICDSCGKTYLDKRSLVAHFTARIGSEPYKCMTCLKVFASSSCFRRHSIQHTDARPYKCETCKKPFKNRSALKRHKIIHTGERPYKCDLCEKTFSFNSALVVHKRKHSGDGAYKCDSCNRTYVSCADFIKHRSGHIRP